MDRENLNLAYKQVKANKRSPGAGGEPPPLSDFPSSIYGSCCFVDLAGQKPLHNYPKSAGQQPFTGLVLPGSKDQQFQQEDKALPPSMARAIAFEVAEILQKAEIKEEVKGVSADEQCPRDQLHKCGHQACPGCLKRNSSLCCKARPCRNKS